LQYFSQSLSRSRFSIHTNPFTLKRKSWNNIVLLAQARIS